MAKPTERAIKRKPMAVIMLTTLRSDVPSVPNNGKDYEWFVTEENMRSYFDQVQEFNASDVKAHEDMAYLTVEITNTTEMKTGRAEVAPATKETEAWLKDVLADITKVYVQETAKTKEGDGQPKVVRARSKSTAAAAVKKADPDAKAQRLKERLAEKATTTKKGETGDKPPAKKAVARKKVSAASEPKHDFVVTKPSTSSDT